MTNQYIAFAAVLLLCGATTGRPFPNNFGGRGGGGGGGFGMNQDPFGMGQFGSGPAFPFSQFGQPSFPGPPPGFPGPPPGFSGPPPGFPGFPGPPPGFPGSPPAFPQRSFGEQPSSVRAEQLRDILQQNPGMQNDLDEICATLQPQRNQQSAIQFLNELMQAAGMSAAPLATTPPTSPPGSTSQTMSPPGSSSLTPTPSINPQRLITAA